MKVGTALIGCGRFARNHLANILKQPESTAVRVVCEPSQEAYGAVCRMYQEAGLEPPPNRPDLDRLLAEYGPELQAALIVTPHVVHYEQAKACLEAGLDVLLEKPMVMNVAEAKGLIETRTRTGRVLTVAFPSSFSPTIRTGVTMLRSQQLGDILTIAARVWEAWKKPKTGTWRMVPEMAGGGFLFDTGAHLLNAITELAGEDFVEIAAWLDKRGTPVDILGVAMGRLKSGALVTIHGCGEAISPGSDIRVFCTGGTLSAGAWGERLEVQYAGRPQFEPVPTPPPVIIWQQFLMIRKGELANPSPPENGLRMAYLWEAIQQSAAEGGRPVGVGEARR